MRTISPSARRLYADRLVLLRGMLARTGIKPDALACAAGISPAAFWQLRTGCRSLTDRRWEEVRAGCAALKLPQP